MDEEHLGLYILQPWMWLPIDQKVPIDWAYTAKYIVILHAFMHTHMHTHKHTCAHTYVHTHTQGTWICTFASCSTSLERISSCFICLSSFSTSASKSDLTSSTTLIFSSSCDSLVLDSNSSWVAMSCWAQENVPKRDTHNKGSESACLPVHWKLALAAP